MKKRRLKFKPYLLLLGLLLIPCNVFAADPIIVDTPPTVNSGAGSNFGGNHFASISGNALSNSQGGPYTAAILASQADAPAGVTMFSNGHVMVNPFQMGEWFVEGQPSNAHNIFDHNWKTYRPGISTGPYSGTCSAGSCPCGPEPEDCQGIDQCTDSCSGHQIVGPFLDSWRLGPIGEPRCITEGEYSIICG